jgi:hypothetical protein
MIIFLSNLIFTLLIYHAILKIAGSESATYSKLTVHNNSANKENSEVMKTAETNVMHYMDDLCKANHWISPFKNLSWFPHFSLTCIEQCKLF